MTPKSIFRHRQISQWGGARALPVENGWSTLCKASLVGSGSKESACHCRLRFNPWVGKNPWRREWQSTPVFSPGKFRGQRGLEGYSPWSCKRVRHDWEAKTFTLCNLYRFSSWNEVFLPREPECRPQRVLLPPSVGCNLRAVDTDHSRFSCGGLISISLYLLWS